MPSGELWPTVSLGCVFPLRLIPQAAPCCTLKKAEKQSHKRATEAAQTSAQSALRAGVGRWPLKIHKLLHSLMLRTHRLESLTRS